jgi:hypothetical protein
MRLEEAGAWLVAALVVVGIVGAGYAGFGVGNVVILVLFLIVSLVIGRLIAGERDRSWLPAMVVAAFLAKMAGAALRYGVYEYVYFRQGDAGIYHGTGIQLAEIWRDLAVPSLEGARGSGTRFLEVITGFLYAPYTPNIIGGFIIFAMVSLLGQILFYAAFRKAIPRGRLKLYAALVFFTPSLVFWPASIGKDAVMVLFIGLAAYAAAGLMNGYEFKWIPLLALGVAGCVAIRPHMGALVVVALGGAMLLVKRPRLTAARVRRLTMIALAAGAVFAVVTLSADDIGINVEELELEPYLDELQRRTNQGGSAVEGEPILSISDLPQGTLRVLFRPLVFEAFNPLSIASGIEGTALLLLIVWKLPRMVRNLGLLRRHPYLMFSALYVAGFVVVFSPILNLGILARQRTQMLPLLLAVIVALGWPAREEEEEPATIESKRSELPVRV